MSENTPLTYGQLPASPAPGVAIHCSEGCDEGYSASRGDYFYCSDDEPVVCGDCEAPMVLLRRVTSFVPVTA